MFDELPIYIDSGENYHIIEKFDTLYGLLVTNYQQSNVPTLHECLEQAVI